MELETETENPNGSLSNQPMQHSRTIINTITQQLHSG